MIDSNIKHTDLLLINELVFKNCELKLTHLEAELESIEYAAHNFKLDKRWVKFRIAKITPTKIGQFVTIWKRNEKGITAPFDIRDDIDLYIIATRHEKNNGIFIFPKAILHQNNILSDNAIGGKRGIRVYPPWDLTTSKQAQKTQAWQINYFLDIPHNQQTDLARAKELLHAMF